MASQGSLPTRDINHPRVRIFDPTFLDSNYMSIPTSTMANARPSAHYAHLFVYNPAAGLVNPRMVSYPNDETEKATILANLPNVLSSPSDFTSPNQHVLTSVMVVETSAALMSTGNLPGGANPPPARFHWRTIFGPIECNHNELGVVPGKCAFPTSPQPSLSKDTCVRFARIFAIGKALEKAVEIFAEAKTSQLSNMQRIPTKQSWFALENLRQMKQVVFLIDDLLLMKWLGKDGDHQGPIDVVQSLCDEGSQLGASTQQKGIYLIIWIRSLIKKIEEQAGVEVLFWGINEANSILSEIRDIPEARSRSPTPELPSLRNIKLRHSPKISSPGLGDTGNNITASNIAASLALKNSLAKISPPSRSVSDSSIPSSPTTSVKSSITTPFTTASTPIPIPIDKNCQWSPHVAYILEKYLPEPTDDRALGTDREIRARPSQVPPPSQLQKVQKQRRDALLRETVIQPENVRKKRKHNIIEVFIGPDGRALGRSQVNARWKGEKRRRAVEVSALTVVSDINPSTKSVVAPTVAKQTVKQPMKIPLGYGQVASVHEPTVGELQVGATKNTGSDTNSTQEDENPKVTGRNPLKRKRGWNLLKGARAGTSGRGRKAANQKLPTQPGQQAESAPATSRSSTASKTPSVERVLPSRATTAESRTRASSQQSS